jgi:hypothetical protein
MGVFEAGGGALYSGECISLDGARRAGSICRQPAAAYRI